MKETRDNTKKELVSASKKRDLLILKLASQNRQLKTTVSRLKKKIEAKNKKIKKLQGPSLYSKFITAIKKIFARR